MTVPFEAPPTFDGVNLALVTSSQEVLTRAVTGAVYTIDLDAPTTGRAWELVLDADTELWLGVDTSDPDVLHTFTLMLVQNALNGPFTPTFGPGFGTINWLAPGPPVMPQGPSDRLILVFMSTSLGGSQWVGMTAGSD